MSRNIPVSLVLVASVLAGLSWSCGGSAREEQLAQLEAENEALRTRLTGQEAEELRQGPPEVLGAASDETASDEWAWADAADAEPPETAPSRVIEPAPEPEPPAPRPEPRAPEPEPVPEPEPRETYEWHEPDPDPEAVPEPEPEPVRMETRRASAGSAIEVLTLGRMDSQSSLVGDPVRAELDRDLLDSEGRLVLPAGTVLTGRITEVQAAKKVKKKSKLAFRLDTATLADGSTVAIAAGRRLEGPGWDKRDGKIIGGSAAGGAVLGQVLGGDTEATAAGAVIGGAIASGILARKKGEPTVVEDGTAIELILDDPVTVEQPAS